MSSGPVRLAPESVEAVARRVVELLGHEPAAAGRLVDAIELADYLGVSRACVYEHADELGAMRIGDGDRPRLRFDRERALAAWQHRARVSEPEQAAPRQRARTNSSTELLPIKGQEAA